MKFNKKNIILSSVIVSFVTFIIFYLIISPSIKIPYEEKLLGTTGGKFNLIAFFAGIGISIYWFYLLISRRYKKAINLQIIIFPLTYRAQEIVYINAYQLKTSYFVQRISVTSLLIVIAFLLLLVNGRIKKASNSIEKTFRIILYLFAISLSITQFFTHTPMEAILLSLGAVWQYIFLFLILISVIHSENDFMEFINSLLIFSLFNIMFRVLSSGQVFIQNLDNLEGQIVRVGTGSLGPAVSYGGYLAIFLSLGICMYRITSKKYYLIYLIVIFIELLNTFTRGAGLIIPLILIGLFWKSERKFLFKSLIILMPIVIYLSGKIWQYFSYRGIQSNIIKINNMEIRLKLISVYINKLFSISLTGNGIGNQTFISFDSSYLPIHNAFLEFLDQCGIIVFIIFIILVSYSVISFLWLINKSNKLNRMLIMSSTIYLFISFIQWILFANTTSTSILFYYPYEGTAIFWILLISPFIMYRILRLNKSNKSNKVLTTYLRKNNGVKKMSLIENI
jgi:hypothetical protein